MKSIFNMLAKLEGKNESNKKFGMLMVDSWSQHHVTHWTPSLEEHMWCGVAQLSVHRMHQHKCPCRLSRNAARELKAFPCPMREGLSAQRYHPLCWILPSWSPRMAPAKSTSSSRVWKSSSLDGDGRVLSTRITAAPSRRPPNGLRKWREMRSCTTTLQSSRSPGSSTSVEPLGGGDSSKGWLGCSSRPSITWSETGPWHAVSWLTSWWMWKSLWTDASWATWKKTYSSLCWHQAPCYICDQTEVIPLFSIAQHRHIILQMFSNGGVLAIPQHTKL